MLNQDKQNRRELEAKLPGLENLATLAFPALRHSAARDRFMEQLCNRVTSPFKAQELMSNLALLVEVLDASKLGGAESGRVSCLPLLYEHVVERNDSDDECVDMVEESLGILATRVAQEVLDAASQDGPVWVRLDGGGLQQASWTDDNGRTFILRPFPSSSCQPEPLAWALAEGLADRTGRPVAELLEVVQQHELASASLDLAEDQLRYLKVEA